jgi:hypothetical protein
MITRIPPTALLEILASKSSPETIVASLNAMERKCSFSQKMPHGNSMRVYPFWKVCLNCATPFQARTREQAVRKKTCSDACKRAMIGASNTGKKPLDRRKGRVVACALCGKEVWKPDAWLKKVEAPTCSRECNGKLRGQDWVKHAHRGRANWTPESEAALKDRMTGETNPAWKGGLTYRNRKGAYANQPIKYVRCPPEMASMARKDGYVMEHRLNVAMALGRPLTRSECVHHINHDATDNRLANLILFRTNAEHKKFEHGAAIEPLWCGLSHSDTSARCGACACQQAPSSRCVTA